MKIVSLLAVAALTISAAIAKDIGIEPAQWEKDAGVLRWRIELAVQTVGSVR